MAGFRQAAGDGSRADRENWSMRWSWSMRAHEYDVYMARVDLEDQVRYRRRMNARHRQVASVAQSKVVQWLNGLDEKAISRMSAADATRLLDVRYGLNGCHLHRQRGRSARRHVQ
jgi:hypothetical protein